MRPVSNNNIIKKGLYDKNGENDLTKKRKMTGDQLNQVRGMLRMMAGFIAEYSRPNKYIQSKGLPGETFGGSSKRRARVWGTYCEPVKTTSARFVFKSRTPDVLQLAED